MKNRTIGVVAALFAALAATPFPAWSATRWSSPSPYPNNMSQWTQLSIPDATRIAVKVTGETERFYDYIYIWNADKTQPLKLLYGDIDQTLRVDGNGVWVLFSSNYDITKIDGDLQVKGQITDADGNPVNVDTPWVEMSDGICSEGLTSFSANAEGSFTFGSGNCHQELSLSIGTGGPAGTSAFAWNACFGRSIRPKREMQRCRLRTQPAALRGAL